MRYRSAMNLGGSGAQPQLTQYYNQSTEVRQGETLAELWIRLNHAERLTVFGTAKEAADIIGVKPGRAYGLYDEGKVAGIKVSGRLFFHLPSLKDWIIRGDDSGLANQLPRRRPLFPLAPAAAAMGVHA